MASKEITITVPEGYEIDKETSTFECIKFKKKKEVTSYRDICRSMSRADDGFYYISGSSIIHDDRNHCDDFWAIGSPSYSQLNRLVALNKLMNVARYLNEKTLNWNDYLQKKWCIYYNHTNGDLELMWYNSHQYLNVYFDSEAHAKQAIEILGEDTVKKALGVFK